MLLAHQKKPSLWGSLLWKDFQQVKLAFLVLVGGALCMQLLFLSIALLTSYDDQSGALLTSVFGIASVTPILLALACSGLLIGHERQSGSWAWSSSLPVSWWESLCSKLIVATLGSLFASLPLGIIPAVFASADVVATFSVLTLLIFLQVIVLCFLATVLMRDTLVALLVAGTTLTVLHSFSLIPLLHRWPMHRFGISPDAAPRLWFLFLSTSIGGAEIYRSLIPSAADERSLSIANSLSQERNNLQRLRLMSNSAITPMHWYAVTRYYPPLRWLYERELVEHHRSERAYFASLPKNYMSGEVRLLLEKRFPK